MFKALLRRALSSLGYEINKKTTRRLNVSPLRNYLNPITVQVNEERALSVNNNKRLILSPIYNKLSIKEMLTSDQTWGFTECKTGDAKFYMAIFW